MEIAPNIISVLAFFVSIATAYFSYINFQRLKQGQKNDNHLRLYNDNNQIRMMFLEKSDLRKYFFSGVKIDESDSLYPSVLSMAEIVVNYLEHLVLLSKGDSTKEMEEWLKLIKQYKDNSPIINKVISTQETTKLSPCFVECYENA
jgi:hypothetical protein